MREACCQSGIIRVKTNAGPLFLFYRLQKEGQGLFGEGGLELLFVRRAVFPVKEPVKLVLEAGPFFRQLVVIVYEALQSFGQLPSLGDLDPGQALILVGDKEGVLFIRALFSASRSRA